MRAVDFARVKSHPFLHELSADQLQSLLCCARLMCFPADTFIFREAGHADALYLILSGHVALLQHIPGRGETQLESLTSGELLGLSWLFPGGRWLLDARTVEPTEVLALQADCVLACMQGDAALGFKLSSQIILQLYQRLERVRLQRLDVYRGTR